MLLSKRAADRMVFLIAERSLAGVRERLWSNLSEMSAAELRGYVRARAFHTVRMQTRLVAREFQIPGDNLEAIELRALERTTQLVVRQPLRQPIMPLPAAHVQLRIAG
jgi:hypothetical protein